MLLGPCIVGICDVLFLMPFFSVIVRLDSCLQLCFPLKISVDAALRLSVLSSEISIIWYNWRSNPGRFINN